MDFHAAMETFAEAWVAANTQTAVNSDPQAVKSTSSSEDLPTLLPKDQLIGKTTEHHQQPPGQNQHSPPVGAGVKSLPIHCVIEQSIGPLTFDADNTTSSTVELDSYAILPSTTLFHELVRASLVKLGYSATETMNAKGAIQIKNWKPLSFDVITSDKSASLDDILGELTQVATLRIRLCSQTKVSSAEEIKGKLLQLLLTQSQDLLLKAGCPIEKSLLSSISMGEHLTHLPSEIRKSFDKWYREELLKSQKLMENSITAPEASPEKHRMAKTPPSDPLPNSQSPSKIKCSTFPMSFVVFHLDLPKGCATMSKRSHKPPFFDKFVNGRILSVPENTAPQNWTDHTVRCAVFSLLKEMSQSSLAKQCPLTQSAISNIANWKYDSKLSKEKCREFGEWFTHFISQKEFKEGIDAVPKDSRLTFHQQHEIPTMRQWYNSCKAPTDDKLRFFAAELNKGHVRQERPKVTVAKLKIWWKNERQREKRIKDKMDSDTNSGKTYLNEPHNEQHNEQHNEPHTSTREVTSTCTSLNSEAQSYTHESISSYLNL